MINYTVPKPTSKFIDDRTGLVNRDWYLFLASLFQSAGGGTTVVGFDDIEYLDMRAGKRAEIKQDEIIPNKRKIEPATQRIEQLEDYVASIRSSGIGRLKTSSTAYPALTLIQLWNGSTGSIPTGWQLCDGTNSTPDMRNLFVIGAGGTYAVGATGGSTTITANNLPTHTHAYTGLYNVTTTNNTNLLYTIGATSLSVTTSVTETPNTPASTTGNNTTTASAYLQPYYAVAYIINTAIYTVINSVTLQE